MCSLSQLAALSEPLSLRYRPVIAAALQQPPAHPSQATPLLGPGPTSEMHLELLEDAAAPSHANMDDMEAIADHTQPLQLPTPAAELRSPGCEGAAAPQPPHASPDQLMEPLHQTPALRRMSLEASKERAYETAAPSSSDRRMAYAGRDIGEVSQDNASTGMQQNAARSTAEAGMPPVDVAARDAVMLVEVSACAFDPHLQARLGTCWTNPFLTWAAYAGTACCPALGGGIPWDAQRLDACHCSLD